MTRTLLMWIGLLWVAPAHAGGARVFLDGDTLEELAETLGAPGLPEQAREALGLDAGEQPPVGTILSVPEGAASTDCQPAYVLEVTGRGTIARPGGAAEPLRPFVALPVGTTVCTGAGSYASLHVAAALGTDSHDTLTLLSETCMTLRATHVVAGRKSAHVQVSRGTVTVAEAAEEGHLVVETAAGVTFARKGGFRVAVEPQATRTEAIAGDTSTLAQGVQVDVPQGFGGRTVVGEAPQPAHALPQPGEPLSPEDDALFLVPRFTWTAVPGAFAYFVEIATDPGFEGLVYRSPQPTTELVPRRFQLTNKASVLWWRITAIDDLGFEGIPSDARRLRLPGVVR